MNSPPERENPRRATGGEQEDRKVSTANATIASPPMQAPSPEMAHPCPLCNESHDEIYTLLAQDKAIRRIPSDSLVSEEEYVARDLVEQLVDGPVNVDLRAYRHHRLGVLREELARRRRLERYGAPGVPNQSSTPPELLERIKRESPVEEVALSLGLVTSGSRPRVKMRCPLPNHEDVRPSATIYCPEARWWCFVCNQGGDVIDLVRAARGLDFRGAVAWLQ